MQIQVNMIFSCRIPYSQSMSNKEDNLEDMFSSSCRLIVFWDWKTFPITQRTLKLFCYSLRVLFPNFFLNCDQPVHQWQEKRHIHQYSATKEVLRWSSFCKPSLFSTQFHNTEGSTNCCKDSIGGMLLYSRQPRPNVGKCSSNLSKLNKLQNTFSNLTSRQTQYKQIETKDHPPCYIECDSCEDNVSLIYVQISFCNKSLLS